MQAFGKAVKWLPMTEMGPPVSVMVSLLDVGGRALHFGPSHPILGIRRISKSDLIMHDVFIEKLEMTPAEVLRPICDAIWQASGLERSFNFDEAGKWRPQPWD
jgi:hypothetical protein